MRVLFISRELGASELVFKLISEQCEVKMYIQDPEVASGLDGFVQKTTDWKGELTWVGKQGLIIFDDIGFGVEQSSLRKEGYRVVGGSREGDRIETDRLVGKQIFEMAGMNVLPAYTFSNLLDAVRFLETHTENRWVAKVNGGHISSLCFVGESQDQSDLIGMLEHYRDQGVTAVNLQQRVDGVEVGVARYFNGKDWVGPIEMNVEHKALMSGEIGPKTAEMGTLMWYDGNEKNHLFSSTLAKVADYLRDIDFRGDVDINCIVNQDGAWPLEFTARFGNPSTALQIELHESPWIEFLSAIADGETYDLKYKTGYGIVVTVAVPPYPYYVNVHTAETSNGLPILFREKVSLDGLQHYGFEEAACKDMGELYIAGNRGCVAHVCGSGKTIELARDEAYTRVKNLIIPKAFYRDDIGVSFELSSRNQLKNWGWLD
ncbi:MAG: hypothetical protein IPJ68_03165 [Candidatus Moraniibacteriota bacterium]|nr:MAG: hypothetical protein IPJ68_03165 [Candidatus Moranbacteria bacterium]